MKTLKFTTKYGEIFSQIFDYTDNQGAYRAYWSKGPGADRYALLEATVGEPIGVYAPTQAACQDWYNR